MSELAGRDAIERRFARALSKVSAEIAEMVLQALGDPPDLSGLTPELMDEIARAFDSVLLHELEVIYVTGAETLMTELGVGVDWGVVNQRAADWARQYSFELVRGITTNSRTMLQAAVSDYYERSMTIDDLAERVRRTFGPVRAGMIAVTETTRAAVEGERAIVEELTRQGVTLITRVTTSNDERVCPICGPKHNQRVEDAGYPPFHVNCRCWTYSEPVEVRNA